MEWAQSSGVHQRPPHGAYVIKGCVDRILETHTCLRFGGEAMAGQIERPGGDLIGV